MTKEELEKVKLETEKLIAELGLSAEVKTDFDKETGVCAVQLESENAASLIGFHGETLQSIQLVLSFFVHKITQKWVRVLVNVGDYRQKREEQLKKLALNLAMKVKFSGEAQYIPNLTASERRIVHLVLADHPDVYTESEGVGRERQLVIKTKGSQ